MAPGYSAEIKQPMDFIKMQRKLDAHQYRSLKQFDSDVQLMVRNCHKFNGASSPFSKVYSFLFLIFEFSVAISTNFAR